MNKKVESSFALAKSAVNGRRSVFERPIEVKTCFSAGDIIPLSVEEVLPGDSINLDISSVVRLTPSVHTTLDNCFLECFVFFIPNRLLWQNWETFITGGATPSAWTEPTGLTIPTITIPAESNVVTSIHDYFGLPINKEVEVNALPYRAYNLVWNTFFRDENLQNEVAFTTEDLDDPNNYTLLKANKYHDLFTSCLPQAQKGPAVNLPLGNMAPLSAIDKAVMPVKTFDSEFYTEGSLDPIKFRTQTNDSLINGGLSLDGGVLKENRVETTVTSNQLHPTNLGVDLQNTYGVYADLTNATASTINQLRLAFQAQMLLETLARCGSRYVEYIKGVFNTISPDYRLQRPEYLGGSRTPVNMSEITQTSATSGNLALGEVAGRSCTRGMLGHIEKSFTEHGQLLVVAVVRNANSYAQGLDKKWTKRTALEFYTPLFANIGEQPLKKGELYYSGDENDDMTFGFQEAWYDYRYGISKITSYFRPGINDTLASWHYSDFYDSVPSLDDTFIQSSKSNIERTLAVQGNACQFIGDFLIKGAWTRCMPVNSIPGRIDHAF